MWGSQSTLNNGRAKISTSRFRKINQNSGNSSSIFPLLKFISCSSETYGLVLFSPADLFFLQVDISSLGNESFVFSRRSIGSHRREREKKCLDVFLLLFRIGNSVSLFPLPLFSILGAMTVFDPRFVRFGEDGWKSVNFHDNSNLMAGKKRGSSYPVEIDMEGFSLISDVVNFIVVEGNNWHLGIWTHSRPCLVTLVEDW